MPRLIWSPPALLDVQRMYRFLADRNQEAGQRAVKAIRAGVRILAAHPEVGRPAEGMESEYREWLIGFGGSGYMVLYRYDGETALIVAVRHQREGASGPTHEKKLFIINRFTQCVHKSKRHFLNRRPYHQFLYHYDYTEFHLT